MVDQRKFEGTWQISNGENLIFFLIKYIDSSSYDNLHAFRNFVTNKDNSLPPKIMVSSWPDLTNSATYKPRQKDYKAVIKTIWNNL